jgi:ribosomal protein L7/L12
VIEEYRIQQGDPDLTHRIEAIKYVREHSSLGLKEAKDVVDRYAPENGQPR